jgi:transcriptional regulator
MRSEEDQGRIELPQGALELLVLRTLERGASHGYAIAQELARRSAEALAVEEGSLYPALHRMERHGWIASEWGLSGTGRRAKFYALTDDGRAQLAARRDEWSRMTAAIGLVLGDAPAGA